MRHKDKILKLRQQGKTYDEIKNLLGCSKGTIAYHCGKNQKSKTKNRRYKFNSKVHPAFFKLDAFKHINLRAKINSFCRDRKTDVVIESDFKLKDVLLKFGTNPTCYLTGQSIDLSKPDTYEFDHIIPISKGGSISLDNLGLTTKEANRCKHNLLLNEFIDLCKKVLVHHSNQ